MIKIKNMKTKVFNSQSKIMVLPRPDNEYRTQEEWINFFNTEKKAMLSIPDVFQLVKENNTEANKIIDQAFQELIKK